MDPIAATPASQTVRPAVQAVQQELSGLLRDGRMLVGEVLARESGGTLLIAIGRFHVPAETDVRMDPGQAFLFRVERNGDAVVLNVLGQGGEPESALLAALRRVIGEERPLSEVLGSVAARIRAELARPGAELDVLRGLLGSLEAHVLTPGAGGTELAEALARSGLRYEAALLAAAAAGAPSGELLARLAEDLKAELLRALERLAEGPVRDAVARALAGLEAEQLLNLARAQAGEAQVWSLPVPDGTGWTTARILVDPRGGRDGESGDAPQASRRLVLGVTFSNTGPLRADLLLDAGSLTVRLVAARREVVDALERDRAELARRLGAPARRVEVHARLGSLAEVSVGVNPLDVRFLRENRLMDVSG